jgi:hypothetical protein
LRRACEVYVTHTWTSAFEWPRRRARCRPGTSLRNLEVMSEVDISEAEIARSMRAHMVSM